MKASSVKILYSFLLHLFVEQNDGNMGTNCNKTISGKSSLQHELLFKLWVSKRPLIMKHFSFWGQNELSFLNTEWCIGGRDTFLKQTYGISERKVKNSLLCLFSGSFLRSCRCAAFLDPHPNFFCVLPFSSFEVHRSQSSLATTPDRPAVKRSACTMETAASVTEQKSFHPSQITCSQSLVVVDCHSQ